MKRIKGILLLFCALFFAVLTVSAQKASTEESILTGSQLFPAIDEVSLAERSFLSLAKDAFLEGDYHKVIRLLDRVLQMHEKKYGKDTIYASYLSSLALAYSSTENFSEAIRFGQEALSIIENKLGKNHASYAMSLSHLASCYSDLGNYSEAIKLGAEVIQIQSRVLGKNHIDYAESLRSQALYNYYIKNYSEAIRLGLDALSIIEINQGKSHSSYVYELLFLAACNVELGKYSDAIRLRKEVLNIQEQMHGKEHADYAQSLSCLAGYNYQIGKYHEAIQLEQEALQIKAKVLGVEHPDYIMSLSNLAASYVELGKYSEAIHLATDAMQIEEKLFGKDHPRYATCLGNLARYNAKMGNYSEAVWLEQECLQIRGKKLGKENADYAMSLSRLASYNADMGNYSKAISFITESLQIEARVLGVEHPNYATGLLDLAAYRADLGDYTEAIRLVTESLQIYARVLGQKHPHYVTGIDNLALYNSLCGNYSEAIRLGSKAVQMRAEILGKEHPNYATSLNNFACYNDCIGNYQEAIQLTSEALHIQEKTIGREHPDYATTLNNLAWYYFKMSNYQEAIRLGTEALRIQENCLGRNHPDCGISLGNLAGYNSSIGNYEDALQLCKKALDISKNVYGKNHVDYATGLANYATFIFESGNNTEAVRVQQEALQIMNKIFGKEHDKFTLVLGDLAFYNLKLGNLPEAQRLTNEEFSIRKKVALDMSQRLSLADRNSYWENEKWHFEERYPDYAYRHRTLDFISIAYDAALLSKGFLLGSEIETRNIIMESGDASLVVLYDSMHLNQQILDKQLERPIKERCLNTDSLRETIIKMERELASKSTAYGSLVANMSVEWKDVQRKLGKNDIAVEFLSFQLNDDSCMYIALTLKDGYESPKMIPLFEEKQLKSIDKNLYYKGTNIYDLVWKPLEKELDGVTNVYFSPSGELYNINIEVLPEIAGITDSRRYYRLSSTRELALTRVDNNKQNASAAIYGGLRYYCAKDSLITDSRRFPRSKNRSIEDFDLSADSIQLRSGYDYLVGTLWEAQKVDSSAVSAKMKSSLYTDFSGTEASFKALDGQGKQLIHIATHGFYYMEKDSVRMREKGFRMLQDESRRRYVEDKALTRSGLLFAGCNNILRGDTITLPEDVDDGILYAKEIARLDLRGLELLTLSACQTGLGDITGEGVFGLQRAFKKAGAQSILMSLWKVDDRATRLFMTRFYEDYLIRKMSKSDALLDAQKYVREYEVKMVNPDGTTSMKRKYENPDYWAAFILLDAI